MGEKLSKKQQRNQVAAKRLEEQRAATAEGFKGADPAGGAHNPGQCTFTFRALQRRLPGLIVVHVPAAPRAPAALSQGPVVKARGPWADFRCRPWHQVVCAVRCLPLGRHPREGGKATRANGCAHTTPPHFQQETKQRFSQFVSSKNPTSTTCSCCLSHTPIALLLCLAECCRTPLHTVHHFTPHTIAHHTPLHPA
jgi:hypothetical protein